MTCPGLAMPRPPCVHMQSPWSEAAAAAGLRLPLCTLVQLPAYDVCRHSERFKPGDTAV